MSTISVQKILASYETDKANDKEHSYGYFYDNLFSAYDRLAKLNIVELGVERGGSLCAWRECFPNANIFGVDKEDKRSDKYIDASIVFYKEDLRDAIRHFKDIDILIDDSDHSLETMVFIAKNYSPLLREKGIIVFEDVQEPDMYFSAIEEAVPSAILTAYDYRPIKGRYDDFIITLEI